MNFCLRLLTSVCCLLLILGIPSELAGSCAFADSPGEGDATDAVFAEDLLNATSIIHITFENNPEVIAARFALEAAEYQFKDFQRNLSQFTPLLAESSIERDERPPHENQGYDMRVGMEKEFFNGSSVFAGVRHRSEFGDDSDGSSNAVEMDVQFPIFGSNTTLRRITQRSREENELFNARLEYVDEVRNAVQWAQEDYFWLLVNWERYDLAVRCASDYNDLLQTSRVQSDPADRQQLEGEIQSLQSDILLYRQRCESLLLELQYNIGLESLAPQHVQRVDLYLDHYYGDHYLNVLREELVERSTENDIKIRVLENAKKNSEEKKRLAEQGHWDIFVNLNGQYDLESRGDLRDDNGYSAAVGFQLRKIDTTLLKYSRRRAEAEIKKYEAEIRGQHLQTLSRIDRQWLSAKSQRQQCKELKESIRSRQEVFRQKRDKYLRRVENIDNLLQARSDLLESQLDFIISLGDYYESITELDHACGVSFEELGISVSVAEARH